MTMWRIFAALAVCAVSCSGPHRWPQRESFYREARCGLSVDSTRTLAERSGGSDWLCRMPTDRLTECNFEVGRTRVLLEFDDGKLQSVEDGDYFGITGMAMRPRLNVCSGERSRDMYITPRDKSWIGATISVDGQPVGKITAGHTETVYVPIGLHILQIKKAGRTAIRREITVPDGTLRRPQEVELP
jgi:hypothetical protein